MTPWICPRCGASNAPTMMTCICRPAAAEAGKQNKLTAWQHDLDEMKATTIERCAQVADKYIGTYGFAIEIAAEIRALKEQP